MLSITTIPTAFTKLFYNWKIYAETVLEEYSLDEMTKSYLIFFSTLN